MQKRSLSLALVLALLITLLTCFGLWQQRSAAVFGLAEEAKEVYLTFDDGPSSSVTPRILDTLKEEGVKATFFVVSDRVRDREEILRRTAAEGHTVGVHSATHRYAEIYASAGSLKEDICTCENVIVRVTGKKPHVYRFPGGCGTAERTAVAEGLGYRVVRWNAVCGDEEIFPADADDLYRETVRTSAGKRHVVLLLHDSATHAATAEALPRIIGYYRAEGYAFRSF